MKGLRGRDGPLAVARAAEETNVSAVLRDPIGRLSRGYRQRIGLAQALLADPPVLLLDEPTVGLDPRQIAETRALIQRLAGERTILLSTHILPEVSATCGRVIILSRGRVVAVDTPSALAARAADARRIEITVDGDGANVEGILLAVPGVLSARRLAAGRFAATTSVGSDLRPEITAALVGRGERLLEIKSADRSLEDVFLDLVIDEEGGAAP
jgi:ABC-2 type transport system ATP-binding protein